LFKESVKFSKNLGPSNLAYSLHLAIDYIMSIYDLKSVDQVILYYKVWVTREDLKVAYDEAVKTLDHVLERRLAEKRIVNHSLNTEVSPSSVPKELRYLKNSSNMAPIFKPDLINYNDLDSNINYTYSSNYKMEIEALDRNNYNIDVVDSNNDKLLSFKDYWEAGSGVLIRKYKDLELKFKNNKLDHSNVKIKMGRLMEVPQELVFDNKIGTIDIETYRSSEASGLMSVYACAYAVEGKTQTYWLGENNLLTGESLIIQMIWDIFNNRLTSNTFYAHNLGKFDGHFLIKTLLDAGFKVKATIIKRKIKQLFL